MFNTLKTYRQMRKVSEKRKESEKVLDGARRRVFKAAGFLCRMKNISDDCTGVAEEIHHRMGRGFEGQHDDANLIASCRPCHRAAHNNPILARSMGLMELRNSR